MNDYPFAKLDSKTEIEFRGFPSSEILDLITGDNGKNIIDYRIIIEPDNHIPRFVKTTIELTYQTLPGEILGKISELVEKRLAA
jgi:hypothetical protein